MFPSVLIVDDEPSILQSLGGLLSDEGFEIMTAANGYEALKMVEAESPDIVLLDVWMPGMDGIETLKEIKAASPHIPVVIITGHGTIETAVKATRIGAFDFIEKPLSIDKVIVAINNALNFRRLEEENRYLKTKALKKSSIDGESEAVRNLKREIEAAAPSDAWILITGENGVGKEMVARTIHILSPRGENHFVDLNCASLAGRNIDSELFGHEKGAFKGATTKALGKLELADGGTLFLDEVSEMEEPTQARLARALQDKKFQRLGSSRELSVDIRVIASTHKNLEKEVEAGRFRKELFFLLNVIPIEVPPLRRRREDIPVLANIFLKQHAAHNATGEKRLSQEALDLLCRYDWPGNVRELKNLMERLTIMVEKETIEASDLPRPYNDPGALSPTPQTDKLFGPFDLKEAKARFEEEFIRFNLAQNNGDVAKTAKAIGVDKGYLQKKINKMKK